MELKDVILSTLAEMEDSNSVEEETSPIQRSKKEEFFEATPQTEHVYEQTSSTTESELMYLNSIRERLLVLFEGFQAPNNSNIEAKIDMTLNFLEYTLATIDTRVKKLEKEV
ncbi:FIG00469478: hypothetical protein [hydrothermal vent metagenome]|uniref:Campylobacter invasion antigen D C-terminal domain-containing protein n=1 Tax=hydrothermal vent metagenome TaxID=652676 RepID=A0A1W1CPV9_9ZZZZ